ncbi:DUF3379 family protein [Salinimonas lutimaris]|uniref:DUF3379 family protein n=1 Tax=Salinimonas lutimaris TaxID=914153 RepID=UPI0010C03752|nr:DUF3379 family protein [Salinimonas lutimaris]
MDELEFRRRVYADPDTTDPEVIAAAQQDPDKKAFREQLRLMNAELKQAAKVPVPDDLAHKLIWQQATDDFVQQKKRTRWYVALAASVALTAGVVGTLLVTQQPHDLGYQALTHVVHLKQELPRIRRSMDLEQVNARLASYGGSLKNAIGNVEVVNYCHLENASGIHLILNTEQGKMSVFVIPQEKGEKVPNNFGNDNYDGTGFTLQNASIMVVGEKGANLNPMAEKVRQNIQFSA